MVNVSVGNSLTFLTQMCLWLLRTKIVYCDYPGYHSAYRPRQGELRTMRGQAPAASTRDRQVDVDGSNSGKDAWHQLLLWYYVTLNAFTHSFWLWPSVWTRVNWDCRVKYKERVTHSAFTFRDTVGRESSGCMVDSYNQYIRDWWKTSKSWEIFC